MSARFGKVCSAIFAVGATVALAGPAFAQVEFSAEGPIQAVVDNGNGIGTITVMDVVVNINAGTTIHSATTDMSLAELANPTSLPGRSQDGFVGGTAIVEGESLNNVVTAADVFVEPAENGLIGESTSALGDPLEINDVPVVLLGTPGPSEPCDLNDELDICDPRLPGQGATVAGAQIFPDSIPTGTLVGADGYFVGDKFYAFLVESEAGEFVNGAVAEASITRSQCRDRVGNTRDELSVLGNTHDPDTGVVTVEISESSDPATFRNLSLPNTAAVVPDIPPIGQFRFQRKDLTFLPPARCPNFVRVRFDASTPGDASDDVFSEPFAVDIRED